MGILREEECDNRAVRRSEVRRVIHKVAIWRDINLDKCEQADYIEGPSLLTFIRPSVLGGAEGAAAAAAAVVLDDPPPPFGGGA